MYGVAEERGGLVQLLERPELVLLEEVEDWAEEREKVQLVLLGSAHGAEGRRSQ